MPLDRTALAALIGGLYPNNTAQAITPEDIRNGMNELVTSLYNITEDDASAISFTSTSPNITATTLVDGVNQAGAQLKTLQDESNVDGLKITGDGTVGSPLTVAEGGLDSSLLGFTSTNTNITATNLVDGVNQAGSQVSDLQDYAINNLAPSKATFLSTHKDKYTGSGFVHTGKHRAANEPVNDGLWESLTNDNRLFLGRGSSSVAGNSKTDHAVIVAGGVVIHLKGVDRSDEDFNPASIRFPPAPDGLQNIDPTQPDYPDILTAAGDGGVTLSTSVLNRQDLGLVEVFHEKISDKDVVYPRGLVQYGNSTWEGITLSSSNVAQGYSAFYEGDTSTVGYSVVWSSLSPAEKALFIQDPQNNIYADNGELVQVRARVRTIRGLEGSWGGLYKDTYSKTGHSKQLGFTLGVSSANKVQVQGKLVTPQGVNQDITDEFVNSINGDEATFSENEGGFYSIDGSTSYSDSKVLYAVPICLVDRYNVGAYHPVHNPQGAGAFWNDDSGNTQDSGVGAAWGTWYHAAIVGQSSYSMDTRMCFFKRNTNSARKGDIASSATVNRPDGGLYDAIPAGRVKDLRILVRGLHTPQSSHQELSKRARNGEARGWEKVPRIKTVFNSASTTNTTTPFSLKVTNTALEILGDTSWITGDESSGWLILADGTTHKIYEVANAGGFIFLKSYTLPSGGLNTGSQVVQAVFGDYIDAPYSEGLFQNITGTPAEIAATFPDGVMGEWLPVIPDGTYKDYKSTDKNLEQYQALVTGDSGATWVNSNINSENTGNAFNTNQTAAQVRVIPFRAKANFTEEVAIHNTTFLHGDFTTGYTTHSQANVDTGNLLANSLANIIPTTNNDLACGVLSFDKYYGQSLWKTTTARASETTKTVESVLTSGTSDGIQWETRVTLQDNLASLIIPYRQITHGGGSYGAGLTFDYVDNTSNTTDDNGQLIQVGTARSLDDLNILLGG